MAWNPQPGPQTSALLADWVDDLFYGGERGGGKSDFQIGYQEDAALTYEGKSRGIMFRKTYPELEELQARACEVFPLTGAVFKTQPSADYPFSNCWYWPNGASVKMRYIEHERDYQRYHGHQYSHLSFDEVTEYPTPAGVRKMISTMRNAHGVPCTMRLTGNPGGVGHGWVKQQYIENGVPFVPRKDPESGLTRMFIPSRLEDNRVLLRADPNYSGRILAATKGNEALRKAWMEGDWNIVAGAFFDCWSQRRHVIRPFEIPQHWLRFRSGDWGSARPFSFGWWAVASDDHRTPEGLFLPRGAMIRYREWYGVKRDDRGDLEPNVGVKMVAEDVGRELARLEARDGEITYGVLDPAAFTQDGGPSIAERIMRGSDGRVVFRRADNARVSQRGALGGWDQMRARLIGEAPERPMIACFSTCTDSIRTIPLLQHDPDRLEDVNTDSEDHAGDDWRYACMSRPWIQEKTSQMPPRFDTDLTISEIIKRNAQRRGEMA